MEIVRMYKDMLQGTAEPAGSSSAREGPDPLREIQLCAARSQRMEPGGLFGLLVAGRARAHGLDRPGVRRSRLLSGLILAHPLSPVPRSNVPAPEMRSGEAASSSHDAGLPSQSRDGSQSERGQAQRPWPRVSPRVPPSEGGEGSARPAPLRRGLSAPRPQAPAAAPASERRLHLLLKDRPLPPLRRDGSADAKPAEVAVPDYRKRYLQLQQAWRSGQLRQAAHQQNSGRTSGQRDPPTATPREGEGGEASNELFHRESVLCPELCA